MTRLTSDDLKALLVDALEGLGFSPANALALASQTVLAEELGQSSVGFSHLFDYIDGLKAGRLDGHAVPRLSEPKPTIIAVDGQGGLPQSSFDMAFETLLGKVPIPGDPPTCSDGIRPLKLGCPPTCGAPR